MSDVSIRFVLANGTERVVVAGAGQSILDAALDNGVPGIVGECGGNCSCATCHVYVEESFLASLSEVDEVEDEMLEGVATPREPGSRLCCQLRLRADLSGIVVRIPKGQF